MSEKLIPIDCLQNGKIYLNGEGSKIRITKRQWDWGFVGYSVSNGVFMGYYMKDGTSFENAPYANLTNEVVEETP